jgi:hypothetical protein
MGQFADYSGASNDPTVPSSISRIQLLELAALVTQSIG